MTKPITKTAPDREPKHPQWLSDYAGLKKHEFLNFEALTFTTDERHVVVIGDNDRKPAVIDIGGRRPLARESLQSGDLDSFLLKLNIAASKGVSIRRCQTEVIKAE